MEIYDYRHDDASVSGFIPRERGFAWQASSEALTLYSSNSPYVCSAALGHALRPTHPSLHWNRLGADVDLGGQSMTLHKESVGDGLEMRVRTLHDVGLLRDVIRRLSDLPEFRQADFGSFRLKRTPVGFGARLVSDVEKVPVPCEAVLGGGPFVAYHGTSTERWERIRVEGFVPGRFKRSYEDLLPDWSAGNVYLAASPASAMFYAKRAAAWDRCPDWVVLEVTLPGRWNVRADDMAVQRHYEMTTEEKDVLAASDSEITRGLLMNGELSWRGTIPPVAVTVWREGRLPRQERDAPVPYRLLVPEAALQDCDERLARGGRLGDNGGFDAEVSAALMSRHPDPRQRRRRWGWHDLTPSLDPQEAIPEGMVEAVPDKRENLLALDRNWVAAMNSCLDARDVHGAARAASGWWSGKPCPDHGEPNWAYLCEYVLVPKPLPSPDVLPSP